MPTDTRLILASASPRRRALMAAAGIPVAVVPPRIDETPRPGEAPRRFVRRAARDKGEEVAARRPGAYVLAADTIVVLDGAILGKPSDRRQAARMLASLAGREHVVHTAVCLLDGRGRVVDEAVASTRVRFRALSRWEVAAYLRTGEGDDKAGAYAAQGAGSLLIERIAGSFTNVVGLPVTVVLGMLRRAGLVVPSRTGPRWYVFPGRRR